MLKENFKKATDIIFVNFLWLMTNLLGIFITVGASTTAMFKVIHLIINTKEPTSVIREYYNSFKENFWFSTLVWLVLVVLFVPLYVMYITALQNGSDILIILAIVGFYQLLIFFIYFFPVYALFKTEKNSQMIRNVILMANTNIWTNIKVIGSLVFVVILVLYVHPAFLVAAIGIYGFLVSFHLKKVLNPYYEQFKKYEVTEEII